MPRNVTMPQLGESVAEGTIGRWIKHEGDRVERDEPIAEIITDKITAELPSPFAGRLIKILVPEDSRVAVGTPIAQIEEQVTSAVEQSLEAPAWKEQQEVLAAATAPLPRQALIEETSMTTDRVNAAADTRQQPRYGGMQTSEHVDGKRQRLSPLVRRLAREHQIDLAQIPGTGLGGRIRRDDVLHYLAQRERQIAWPAPIPVAQPAVTQPAAVQPSAPMPAIALAEGDQVIPMSDLRRAMIESLVRSKDVPQAVSIIEIDMTNIVTWQEQYRSGVGAREGVSIDYVPFVMRAIVAGLKQFPQLNSIWAGDQIVLKKDIHLGVSVTTDEGWITPVIRQADKLNVLGLARAIADLTQRAQTGRLTIADIQGGTFTVNNPGPFGTLLSASAISHPQVAALTMDAIVERPIAVSRMIGIRPMMYLCLSFDQRVVDGAIAGKFLKFTKDRLEGPVPGIYD